MFGPGKEEFDGNGHRKLVLCGKGGLCFLHCLLKGSFESLFVWPADINHLESLLVGSCGCKGSVLRSGSAFNSAFEDS